MNLLEKIGIWAVDYVDAAQLHVRAIAGGWRVPEHYAHGEPGKPTIVLIPGVYERWNFLKPIADRLWEDGYPISIVHGLGYNLRPIIDTSDRLAAALSRVRANPAGRIIVAHSKGGLVGKHLMLTHRESLGIRGLVAVCTPFAGSRYAKYVLGQTLRAFSPTDDTIVLLGRDSSVNSEIVSIFGPFDPHVPDGSVLVGATNVQVPVSGHFRILHAPDTIDAAADAVGLLANRPAGHGEDPVASADDAFGSDDGTTVIDHSPSSDAAPASVSTPTEATAANAPTLAQDHPDILVSAVALVRDRRVLMVRARGRDVLYMPGGKIDDGETAMDAAVREAREEVAVGLVPGTVHQLFTVVTQAHGEPDGRQVRMVVFSGVPDAEPRPSAEVSEVHWVTTADADRCPPAGTEVLKQLAALDLID
ncbi:NUDIX domain-containing protein [Mycetocola zhujimingii]|uniref:NUDIX domain-containing protein n=1 Tax=Mycetocola zhujimingii TaxID=2079792 RepID=UPI001F1FB4F3|nr:NUDIX domain-containing protein [Mycetocola zhujimingii]